MDMVREPGDDIWWQLGTVVIHRAGGYNTIFAIGFCFFAFYPEIKFG